MISFRFNVSTIERFNESLARQSLGDGGTWRQPALYERPIKREGKLAGAASRDRTREMISFDSTVQRFNE
jgi:hypothetical protein